MPSSSVIFASPGGLPNGSGYMGGGVANTIAEIPFTTRGPTQLNFSIQGLGGAGNYTAPALAYVEYFSPITGSMVRESFVIGGGQSPTNLSIITGSLDGSLATGAIQVSVYSLGGSPLSVLGSERLGRIGRILGITGDVTDAIDAFSTNSAFRIMDRGGTPVNLNDPQLLDSARRSLEDRTQTIQSPRPPSCFLAGTPILMADGSTKPIEDIRPGDEVASFDPNAQQGLGPLKPGKVTRTFTNITKTIINLRGTHMTPGHVVLMDNGEWDIIARALKDDRAIVEERKGADGASKAILVRARTGAVLGSLEDMPIKVIFADPATGRDRLALVRAGIPVKGKKLDDGNLRLYTMADILTMQDYRIEPDGTILCKDGHRYEATPWADEETTPYHLPMRENWLLALDGETYTPPWILDLPLEQEEVGQMVVNDLPNPKMFVNPTKASSSRPQLGLAPLTRPRDRSTARSGASRPPNSKR